MTKIAETEYSCLTNLNATKAVEAGCEAAARRPRSRKATSIRHDALWAENLPAKDPCSRSMASMHPVAEFLYTE
jgi:hypothetical protein